MQQGYKDPHTASNYNDYITRHIELDAIVDFKNRRLLATATLTIELLKPEVSTIILDTQHLKVHSVTKPDSNPCQFHMTSSLNKFSDALLIEIQQEGPTILLKICYETVPGNSSALQWLAPEQTLGKKHPYLFTQCQSIYARTLLPCQDTSSVKATYSAAVSVSKELVALMSALSTKSPTAEHHQGMKTFFFSQTIPIPSYLIAIAVGDLHQIQLSPRCSVWCELEQLQEAANEFKETEKMLQIAESLAGPYLWRRYDLLVLPGSFPYGGMENPCLTFITPSILAGDCSLVDVVAHEIAHSWTGNLVTAASAEHFWLNEGFTRYLEDRILGVLHGERYRQFVAILGLSTLRDALRDFGYSHPFTRLVPDLSNAHPDESFSTVPYEKGCALLMFLEELLGIERFDRYLRSHIKEFSHKSISTAEWLLFLQSFFASDPGATALLKGVSFDEWLYGTGDIPNVPKYSDSGMLEECKQVHFLLCKESFDSEQVQCAFSVLSQCAQRIVCLDLCLQDDLTDWNESRIAMVERLLGRRPGISLKNVELEFRFLQLALRQKPAVRKDILSDACSFACKHGRMKYCRRMFKKIAQIDHSLAESCFMRNKSFYHPIAVSMISADLEKE